MNAVSQFFAVDFVVTVPGGTRTPASLATLLRRDSSPYTPLAPGEYDLYVTRPAQRTVSGPTRFSVKAGGIYSVLTVDGLDTATAAVRLLDDFPGLSAALRLSEAHDLLSFADYQLAHAPVAQWIERSPPKRKVAGSIPARGAVSTRVAEGLA